jgi:hypothetical protein
MEESRVVTVVLFSPFLTPVTISYDSYVLLSNRTIPRRGTGSCGAVTWRQTWIKVTCLMEDCVSLSLERSPSALQPLVVSIPRQRAPPNPHAKIYWPSDTKIVSVRVGLSRFAYYYTGVCLQSPNRWCFRVGWTVR